MSGIRGPFVPGPVTLIPGQPTSRPNNARALGDVGPGHPGIGITGAAQNILQDAMQSDDPAVQAAAAAAGVARVRNCRVVSTLFSAPAKTPLGAGELYGFRQQILPQNNDRKILVIGNPWSHGNPPGPFIQYLYPGEGSANFIILFQPGPTSLTPISNVNELSTYIGQSFVPIGNGGAYQINNFEIPPTNPVTIVAWQWYPNAGGYGYDVNATIMEGV